MKEPKPLIMWAVKDDIEILVNSVRRTRMESRDSIAKVYHESGSWSDYWALYHKQGYRLVRVEVKEVRI